MSPHPVHFYIVVWIHICFDNLDHRPKGVLFAKNLAQAEHQKVEPLDVTHGRISPNERRDDPLDRLFNFSREMFVLGESSGHVPLEFVEHVVGVGLQGSTFHGSLHVLVVVFAVVLLVDGYARARIPKVGSDCFGDPLPHILFHEESIFG